MKRGGDNRRSGGPSKTTGPRLDPQRRSGGASPSANAQWNLSIGVGSPWTSGQVSPTGWTVGAGGAPSPWVGGGAGSPMASGVPVTAWVGGAAQGNVILGADPAAMAGFAPPGMFLPMQPPLSPGHPTMQPTANGECLRQMGPSYVRTQYTTSKSGTPSPTSPQSASHSPTHGPAPPKGSSGPQAGTAGDLGSSSEEEDEEDVTADAGSAILQSTLNNYSMDGSGDTSRVSKLIVESLTQKPTCLICISSVKRADAVFSCVTCFCQYHVGCIASWARDRVDHGRLRGELNGTGITRLVWDCPKCRHEYTAEQIPAHYLCFCGQTRDPPVDPWLVPHSCGKQCNKPLHSSPAPAAARNAGHSGARNAERASVCTHKCTLRCHPGPCPPCPQMVSARCECGKSSPVSRRCSNQSWTCDQACGRKLNCGRHTCSAKCHTGECGPCGLMMVQSCECGAKQQLTLCTEEKWRCEKVCGKMFDCGLHSCEQTCHSGACGPCPTSGLRTCPCGSTTYADMGCADEAPLCENVCGRVLLCGQHSCEQLCHRGDCGTCRQQVTKRCRCGKKSKAVLCGCDFTCESKCTNLKDCGRHQCKKKCCTGNCAPCDNTCLKPLGCKNHKCQARCHSGSCYPCQLTVTLYCECRSSSTEVACGREKTARRPPCRLDCQKRPACHHPSARPHKCHPGNCPACNQTCGKRLDCGHACAAACHSAVWTKIQPKTLLSNETVRYVQVSQPCPPCRTQVDISCLGLHQSKTVLCSEKRPYSCGSQCGRALSCGNHQCEQMCHVVNNPPDQRLAGDDCDECEKGCELPRPEGCEHQCSLPCHLPPCPPCRVKLARKCRCGHLKLLIPCCEWTEADETERFELLDGKHPCPIQMECGHACTLECHPPGACLAPSLCTKPAEAACPCGRLKQPVVCNQSPTVTLQCDEVCEQRREKRMMRKQQKEKRTSDPKPEEPSITNASVRARQKQQPQSSSKQSKKSPALAAAGSVPPSHKSGVRGYFLPLLLAVLAILGAIYISVTAELA